MIYVILAIIINGIGSVWALSQSKDTLDQAGVRLGHGYTSSDKKQQV
jgi:hypothetical protein